MTLFNQTNRYGLVQRIFHWSMAALIIGQIALGWVFASLPKGSTGRHLGFYWHVILAMVIFTLVMLRIGWRLSNLSVKPLSGGLMRWLISSHGMHSLLYILLCLLPISGYLLVTAEGHSLNVASFTLPSLICHKPLAGYARIAHEIFAYVLSIAVGLHIVSVWWHVLYKKQRIFKRIWGR